MKLNLFSACLALAVVVAPFAVAADSASATLENLRHYTSGADATPLRRYEQLVAQAVNDTNLRQSVEADLDRVLTGDATFEAKRFACKELAVIGTSASVPALANLLKDEATAGIACLALANNPSPEALTALRAALGTTRGLALAHVIHTLGERRDTKAVAQLIKLARDTDATVAESATVALGKIATPGAARSLAALRRDESPALRLGVADGSIRLAERLAAGGQPQRAAAIYTELLATGWPENVRRGAFLALLRLDRDGGERRIVSVLEGTDAALKPAAIAAISGIRGMDASQKFAAELPKLVPAEQALLVESLAERHDPVAQAAVQAQLQAADASVRLAAIGALGRNGDAAMVPVLARALATAQSDQETAAIEDSLTALNGGELVDRALTAQLRNRMAGPKTPLLVVLARRGSSLAVPVLLAETASSDATTAKIAFQGVGRLAGAEQAEAAVRALAGLRAPDARAEAETAVAQVLSRVGNPARRSAIVRAALGWVITAEARCSLVQLLPTCGDADALAALKTAMADNEPAVREAATRALAEWPDMAAWDMLVALYAQTDNEAHRVLALRGLVRLAGEENARPDAVLVARYRQLLAGAQSDDDRKLVLGALAGAADPDALKLAEEMLANPGVRAEAELAVRKIADAVKATHPEAAAQARQQLEKR